MATKCGYCSSSIIIGGVSAGGQKFCNKKCAQNAHILSITKDVPAADVERKVEEIWRGNCPRCGGLGPIDVHKYYQIWSAIILTHTSTKSQASCRSCATKRQLGATIFSFVFGWWGFPWGIGGTPIQITKNIIGMTGGPDRSKPSEDLKKMVLVNLGAQRLAQQKAAGTQAPSPSKA